MITLLIALIIAAFTACQPEARHDIAEIKTAAIIGGEEASTKEFPFIVNIWQNSPEDAFVDHLCGGSLVAKRWILTAAHCVLEDVTDKSQGTVKAAELTVYIGSDKISGQGGRAFKVKSIQVHPSFSWPKHDIALIELGEEVKDVTPVALNDKDLGASASGLTATVAGWGLTDAAGKIDSSVLRKVRIPLISRADCTTGAYPKKQGWKIEADTLCASSSNDTKSACPGDSGGPLVLSSNNGPVLVGIVSWGTACHGGHTIANSVEGYADVANALPWIRKWVQE